TGLSGQALAQTAPDAGQTLQQLVPPPALPQESKPMLIQLPAPATPGVPGGPQVELRAVTFKGNTVYSEDELKALLGESLGKRYDLAGLRALAEQVSAHYRVRGYPFARAFIPPQEFSGSLHIEVLEGRYGAVQALGDADLVTGAQPFLAALKSADLIESSALERTMLLLQDQPGVKVVPTIKPGQQVGSGDLMVGLDRESRFGGEVGVDNAGNRYTGQNRARATLYANSPFLFGDRVTLNTLVTNESLWLGSLDYELPVGGSGLRAQFGYAHTSYSLGREFENLMATGLARVSTGKLSYPIVRSQLTNVQISAAYQHKLLQDNYGSTGTSEEKSSRSWPLAMRFDHRDRVGGGGISYGALTWTGGRLSLDNALAVADASTAKKEGNFSKLNVDVARIQKLPGEYSLYGRYSGQWADKNLDSSERFGLGGNYGVRAYPLGEGMGDRGALVQVELRYDAGVVAPYVLYDAGQVRVNHTAWDEASAARRFLSGYGVGMRANYQGWNMDLALAWRINGGVPQADVKTQDLRALLQLNYRF
ncbi:MAG: ShlB/FhaC/HecB family hemolysin secretion/activation protein, partial [Curvibacter sp.]